METRILSGPLRYSSQRSVVRDLLVTDHDANGDYKLRNPNAQSFTHTELQRAMLETIASINQFSEEVGITEVCWPVLAHGFDFKPRHHFIAQLDELLCNRWSQCRCDPVCLLPKRRSSFIGM